MAGSTKICKHCKNIIPSEDISCSFCGNAVLNEEQEIKFYFFALVFSGIILLLLFFLLGGASILKLLPILAFGFVLTFGIITAFSR